MLLGNRPVSSALVAFVALSLSVSASVDPIERHIIARDPALVARQAATGKLAPPVHIGSQASTQAVLALTGDDLHTPSTLGGVDDSKFAAPAAGGKSDAAVAALTGDTGEKSHCYLGHTTAKIKRVRYTMTIQLDQDESGATTIAGSETVKGAVVKATSGLYEKEDPMKGSCAKTLARHGEYCANRPYIVPRGVLPATSGQSADEQQTYHAGPYIQKRHDAEMPLSNRLSAVRSSSLVFKRAAAAGPLPGTTITTTTTAAGRAEAQNAAGDTVCIDTVKRDQRITKIVPTSAKKAAPPTNGSQLHFELVRTDANSKIWNQVIYDSHGKPIDVTHLELTENMSFWRAEYFCATCPPGHQKHTVLYENVEIELHEDDEHKDKTRVPEVKCQGSAQATNVHKREKSKYAHKNGSGIEYQGVIFSIDRVMLGAFDKNGNGGGARYGEGRLKLFRSELGPGQKREPEDGRIGITTVGTPAQDEPQKPGSEEPNKPIHKRAADDAVEQGEPVF